MQGKNSNKNNVWLWKDSEAKDQCRCSDYFYLIAFFKWGKRNKQHIILQVILNIRLKTSLRPADFYFKCLELQRTRGTHNKSRFLFHESHLAQMDLYKILYSSCTECKICMNQGAGNSISSRSIYGDVLS